jgi:hypothetical protein
MKVKDRLKHAWNAFNNNDRLNTYDYGYSSARPAYSNNVFYSTSSYVSSIYNRIAMDASMTSFSHVKINPDNDDTTDMKTGLNNCLTVEANIDQTHIQLIHDLVYSMFDEGVVAVVPVDTTLDPTLSGSYDINSLRVGRVLSWYPKHVDVWLYNDNTGFPERITIAKNNVAIVENPLSAVINRENSVLKRLIRKLSQLDVTDDNSRLDLVISVPYGIKTETQKQMAMKRIADIESQLAGGRHGIAYIDGTEKVMQLNRPVNSQLLEEITMLTQQFYNQLGLTQNIFNGTATEGELRTYYSRTIDPIVNSITAEFTRKFLTKTARSQGQVISSYRDMFNIVPVETIATLGDTFRRNGIASSNELRKIIGLRRSNDARADELFNPNIADKNQNATGDINGIKAPTKPDLSKLVKKPNGEEKPGSLTPPGNSQNG